MKIFLLFLLFLLNTIVYANTKNETYGAYCLYVNDETDEETVKVRRLIVVKIEKSNKCNILTTRIFQDNKDGSFHHFNNFDLLKLQITVRLNNGENKTTISTLSLSPIANNPSSSSASSTVIESTNADDINTDYKFTFNILNPSFGNSFIIKYQKDEDGYQLTRRYRFYKQISLEESNNLEKFMF